MGSFRAAGVIPAWVAIDVARKQHEVLIETANGARRRIAVDNTLADFEKFAEELKAHKPCEVAIEPTGDYHRPLANFLIRQGHKVHFVSP